MDKQRFTQLVSTYGSNPTHWGEAHRADMLAFMRINPEARAVISHEEALDNLLAARLPDAPTHLQTIILNEMEAALNGTASQQKKSALFSKNSFWQELFLPQKISMGLGLASICLAGVFSAPMIADILNPPDMFAIIEVATADILLLN